MRILRAGLPVLFVTVACFSNAPLPTTPTADNPCGETYVPCTDAAGAFNHMCCDEDNTCGGGKFDVGCPPAMCCFIGGPLGPMTTRGDAGTASPSAQFPPRTR